MKSQLIKAVSIYRSQAFFLALLLLSGLAAANAQTFYPNVPDFYQHQKFGPKDDGLEDPKWEKDAAGKAAGWCDETSTIDQFYYWKKANNDLYKGLLPDDIFGGKGKWLPAANEAIKLYVTQKPDGSDLRNKQCGDEQVKKTPYLKDYLNCILDSRDAGPKLGIKKGLIHTAVIQYYDKDSTQYGVAYYSAEGKPAILTGVTTLFEAMQKYLNDGATVKLNLSHKKSDKLWWAGDDWDDGNTHAVTVAGIVTTKGKERIWFTDPDSNPDHDNGAKDAVKAGSGNANNNAGWGDSNDPANCGADGKKHTVLECIRLRRFVGNEDLPVPKDGKKPTPPEIGQRYYEAVMQPKLFSFMGTGKDFDRYDGKDSCVPTPKVFKDPNTYDGTCIYQLDVIQVLNNETGTTKSPSDPANIFTVSPGQGATPIDEFWVFPATYEQGFKSVEPLTPGWVYDPPGSGTDPWGNVRPYSWVRVYTDPNGPDYNPLVGDEEFEMQYTTIGNDNPLLTAYDIVVRDGKNDMTLGVQAVGANPPTPPEQKLEQ